MPTGVLFSLSLGQLEAFAKAIEVGKTAIADAKNDDNKKAGLAKDLASFLQNCLEIPRILQRRCDSVLDHIATRSVDNYEETENELRRSFAEAEQIFRGVLELSERFLEIGGSLPKAANLQGAITEVENLKSGFFAHWPHFTHQDAEEAMAAYQRGECLDADEAFSQIKGVTKESWLQLVQAHRPAPRV